MLLVKVYNKNSSTAIFEIEAEEIKFLPEDRVVVMKNSKNKRDAIINMDNIAGYIVEDRE